MKLARDFALADVPIWKLVLNRSFFVLCVFQPAISVLNPRKGDSTSDFQQLWQALGQQGVSPRCTWSVGHISRPSVGF